MYGQDVKIFLLTGNVMANNGSDIEEIFDGVLFKPCSKKELGTLLEQHALKKRKPQASPQTKSDEFEKWVSNLQT